MIRNIASGFMFTVAAAVLVIGTLVDADRRHRLTPLQDHSSSLTRR